MKNFDKVLDAFMSGDYFIIFLVLTFAILAVLILALIKSRQEYNELLKYELENRKSDENKEFEEKLESVNEEPKIVKIEFPPKEETVNQSEIINDKTDLNTESKINKINSFNGFEELLADTKEDTIDENKPLIKQVDIPSIKTYDDVINEYENSEEENAVISAEELEKKTKERMDALGINDNQVAIQKYEEEQEKKAIISYEQLLKNASNITLSYKEEKNNKKDKNSPKINKIEVQEKEVVGAEMYIKEDEFLKILKNFRARLE